MWQYKKTLLQDPITAHIAAVSVGIVNGEPTLDLDYQQDSNADTDLNLVMNAELEIIEIQGTAEQKPFSENALQAMIALGKDGIQAISAAQKKIITAWENM